MPNECCNREDDTAAASLPAGVVCILKGRAGTGGEVTANRRCYPTSEFRRVVREFNARPEGDELLGELDHPDWRPRLASTAMRITGLNVSDGKHLDFKAHLLDNAVGQHLHSLLKGGVAVGVSMRGSGELKPCCAAHKDLLWCADTDNDAGVEGVHEPHCVVSDYKLHGVDAVACPAAPGARMAAEAFGDNARGEHGDRGTWGLGDLGTGAGGSGPASAVREAVERTDMELRETPGDGELTALRARVAAMDAEAKASGEARAALEADLGAMKANFALLETAAASERAAAAAALAEANAEREALRTRVAEATIALNARAVQGRVSEIVGALRPDVQAKVLEQLNACTTVEAVNERWATLEGILSAAGVTRVEPAGAGLVHPDPVPERDGARSRPNLTTEQQMQRELLGLR